jgi:hypothetical protein
VVLRLQIATAATVHLLVAVSVCQAHTRNMFSKGLQITRGILAEEIECTNARRCKTGSPTQVVNAALKVPSNSQFQKRHPVGHFCPILGGSLLVALLSPLEMEQSGICDTCNRNLITRI